MKPSLLYNNITATRIEELNENEERYEEMM